MNIYIPVQVADEPNKNNHVYPKEVLEKAVADFKERKCPMFGTFGMQDFTENPDRDISIEGASHSIEDLKMDGNVLLASVNILDTPISKKIKAIGTDNLAFRMAGIGTIKTREDGAIVINDDFKLVTINACLKTDAA